MYLFIRKETKNKRQGFPLKLWTLIPFLLYFIFFSNLNFKLKRLRCKDSLKSTLCAHVFKGRKKEKERKKYRKLNYPCLHRSGVSFRVRLWLSLTPHSQLPWPVPGSEIVGSAKLRKRDHENKTGGNCGATPPPPPPLPRFPDHTLIFSGGVRSFTRHPYYLRAWNRLQLPQVERLLTPLPPWIVLGVRSQTLSYTSTST